MTRKSKSRSKQYIVHALGVGVGVTFDLAEEKRVKAKADRKKISVEELISRAITDRARRERAIKEPTAMIADRAVKALAAPQKRRSAR